MAVKTKHTFSAANGSTAAFSGHGIELNNLDDLDVYVTLSGGTRVLQLRQSTGSTAQSSHPQVNNTDGLYFPAVSAGTTLYNYQLTTANDTITFNSNLPSGAIVTVERRTRDGSGDYTTFAGGSTVRHTDLNRSATESNYTAQEARNKVFEIEGKLFGDAAKDSSFITSADIVDGTIVAADLASNSVTTDKIQDNAVTADKLAHTSVSAGSYTAADITVDAQGRVTSASSGTIGASEIAGDAINGDKIADNSINSEHYVDGSIDTVHLADDSVTDAKLAAGAIGTNGLANGAVTTVKLAADAVNGDKIADNSINSEHYVDGSIDTIHIGDNQINTAKLADNAVETANILDNNVTLAKLGSGALPTDITVNADNLVANSVGTSEIATDAVNGSKIADNAIDSEHYTDGSIDTAHIGNLQVTTGKIAADAIDGTKLADNAVGTEHIAANAVTTTEIADAELTTLAGMQSGTASNLASSTALTSTNAELNLLDGKSIVTAISGSSTDVQLPTAKAVNDQIVNTISDVGGFVPVANEVSFPNTNPDPGNNAGTIVSIADAGGIVVNGSGVSTTGRTLGGATVTINGIDSTLYNTTIAAGKGMLVQTTSTLNTYDYHRLIVDEAGVAAAQTLVSDFNQRYRVGSSNPTSSLDDGDLFFNTSSNKMLVYNASDTSWDDVQSVGNYFINTISSYSGTGGNSATFNGTAYRFVLSNAGTYAEQHLVSINGVVQKPNSGTSQPSEGFAIDGSSIIFSTAPPASSDYFIITIGAAVNIGTPGNNTVSTATLQNLAVTGDKIATNLDLADNKKIRFGTGNDLELYHDGSNSYIKDTGTGALVLATSKLSVNNAASNEELIVAYQNGSVELFYDNVKKFETTSSGVVCWGDFRASGAIDMEDNERIKLGTGDDLQIYHDGSDSYIKDAGTGQLHIHTNEFRLQNAAGNEQQIATNENGDVQLFYDGVKKFETHSGGCIFTGNLYGLDNHQIQLGNSNDFKIYHDGTDSIISNATNVLKTHSSHLFIRNAAGNEDIAKFVQNGSVELYYDGVKKCETHADGLHIGDGGNLDMPHDSSQIVMGASDDLKIFHDGSNSYLANSTGNLYIRNGGGSTILIQPLDGEDAIKAYGNDRVELAYDHSKKLETTSQGIKITDGGPVLTVDATNNSSGLRINVEAQTTGELLRVQNDGTTKFQITHDGKAAFGTTNTTATAGTGFKINSSSAVIPWVSNVIDTTTGNHSTYHLYNLHSSHQGYRFYVTANGGISNYSSNDANLCDEREKKSITDAPSQLATVKAWKLRNFRYNFQQDSEPLKVGVIAQEIETVNPELVSEEFKVRVDDDGNDVLRKGVKEEQMMMISIKALQELITKVETLETKVAALEAK